MTEKLNTTVKYIESRLNGFIPQIGILLGSGLGSLADQIEVHAEFMYSNIPGFPISTVEFHAGKLIFGMLKGKRVVAMQGRLHYYEGYSMQQITYPVRVMKMLGMEYFFLSNACGSLNEHFKKGDLVIIEDHINLMPDNPLRGHNSESFGPRFPDLSHPYDETLINIGMKSAEAQGIQAHLGIYVAAPGPSLETRAEYRYMRTIGGDVVGMSNVPEVIVANHMSLPVFAVSVVTDENFSDRKKKLTQEAIVAIAEKAEPNMSLLFTEVICSIR